MFEPGMIILGLWLAWVVSWIAAAAWSAPAAKRAGAKIEITYRIPLVIGAICFGIPAHGYRGRFRLWHVTPAEAWVCAGLVFVGMAITWWARIQLGEFWSAEIARKDQHPIIEQGPYAFVRHPIYTGLILAFLATLAAKGTVLAVIGTALLILGFWMKARYEEKFLENELDRDTYEDYRRQVPMLIPWKWTPGRKASTPRSVPD